MKKKILKVKLIKEIKKMQYYEEDILNQDSLIQFPNFLKLFQVEFKYVNLLNKLIFFFLKISLNNLRKIIKIKKKFL